MRTGVVAACMAFLVLVVGCASVDTADLRIGMTRDEVIKAMGKPDTVGADGVCEYLNYRIASRTGGYVGFSQPYSVRLTNGRVDAFGLGAQVGILRPSVPRSSEGTVRSAAATPDSDRSAIRIISVTPSVATADQPTEFRVKIAYALNDADEGVIHVMFNTDSAKGHVTAIRKPVRGGTGEVEVVATVTPKNWGALTGFAASVMLRAGAGDAAASRPVAYHTKEISLRP